MILTEPLLEVRDLEVTFGHIQALRGASLTVGKHEIVGLVGDNGAGKSTLVKAISGVRPADSGQIYVEGAPATLGSPAASRDLGIEVVYQDLALASHLDSVENLFLGRQLRRGGVLRALGFVDRAEMRRVATETFVTLKMTVKDLSTPVGDLSGGQRQAVAVARAAHWAERLIIMDEPTAALGPVQTEQVGKMIRRVREHGLSVLVVSHDLPQVLDICDRVVVFRHGLAVASVASEDIGVRDLVDLMSGAEAADEEEL
ncbi:ATP-binding cassette domain-containing protein [Nocardioides sp. LMS-CY]|uniref:ATP-binding cassette domain-containing protein n=1 Tax=Nocardioides sp. (strain LMS-CY) TaxID=2840457 RepID=UPI001BFFFBAE|nr:ATP-binding cassette domain-containing protein [Nocardioides sp. LMS-CY]QWF20200.1 ATP-binding cassette domain-containing protein [Nocardioides sp. LMS-CY]